MATHAGHHLANFVCERRRAGVPTAVLHSAKRLLLNQLTASATAALLPAGAALLQQASRAPGGEVRGAVTRLWWSQAQVPVAQAVAVHAQLLGMLDLGDTHLHSLGRFAAAIVPPLLAQADIDAHEGCDVLEALALGLEVEIACAGPAWCGPPGLGAAVARGILLGLEPAALMATLAGLGGAPAMADERCIGALQDLGGRWRLQDLALHCRPLPAQALAPVDAVLALRAQCQARRPRLMQLGVSAQAWLLLQAPSVADDLRRCMAAAWLMGRFTTDEQEPACWDSPAARGLAAGIDLRPDPRVTGLEACSLTVHFEDGTSESTYLDAFLGSAAQPLSDSQLSELFRSAADDLVLPRRAGEILHALWGLDLAPDSRVLTGLLRLA